MRMPPVGSVLLALYVALPAQAFTQMPVPLGARVRVTDASLPTGQHSGVLRRIGPDTLVIDSLRFLRSSITRFELSAGSKSHWLVGMGIGLVAGGVAGAIAGAGICADSDEWSATSCAVLGGAVLGAAGMALGALIGTLVRSERWTQHPLEEVRIGVQPVAAGAFRFVVAVRF